MKFNYALVHFRSFSSSSTSQVLWNILHSSGFLNKQSTWSCLYVKFRWLIFYVQLSFQPISLLRRLRDSRGDTAVPVRDLICTGTDEWPRQRSLWYDGVIIQQSLTHRKHYFRGFLLLVKLFLLSVNILHRLFCTFIFFSKICCSFRKSMSTSKNECFKMMS